MNLILVILLIVLLFGGGFGWHSYGQPGGIYMGGGVGLLLLVVLVLAVLGRI